MLEPNKKCTIGSMRISFLSPMVFRDKIKYPIGIVFFYYSILKKLRKRLKLLISSALWFKDKIQIQRDLRNKMF